MSRRNHLRDVLGTFNVIIRRRGRFGGTSSWLSSIEELFLCLDTSVLFSLCRLSGWGEPCFLRRRAASTTGGSVGDKSGGRVNIGLRFFSSGVCSGFLDRGGVSPDLLLSCFDGGSSSKPGPRRSGDNKGGTTGLLGLSCLSVCLPTVPEWVPLTESPRGRPAGDALLPGAEPALRELLPFSSGESLLLGPWSEESLFRTWSSR